MRIINYIFSEVTFKSLLLGISSSISHGGGGRGVIKEAWSAVAVRREVMMFRPYKQWTKQGFWNGHQNYNLNRRHLRDHPEQNRSNMYWKTSGGKESECKRSTRKKMERQRMLETLLFIHLLVWNGNNDKRRNANHTAAPLGFL